MLRAIDAAPYPVWAVLVPLTPGDRYGGDAARFLSVLHGRLGRDGVYVTVDDPLLTAAAFGVDDDRPDLHQASTVGNFESLDFEEPQIRKVRRFVEALSDPALPARFERTAARLRAQRGASPPPPPVADGPDDDGTTGWLVALGILAALGAGSAVVRRRRRHRHARPAPVDEPLIPARVIQHAHTARAGELREQIEERLIAFAERIDRRGTPSDAAAQERQQHALDAYAVLDEHERADEIDHAWFAGQHAAGRRGVPPSFGCRERPNPCDAVPNNDGRTPTGFNISVQFNGPWAQIGAVDVDSATVAPAGGDPVNVIVQTRQRILRGGVVLIPRHPLRYGTTYVAAVSGTVAGRAEDGTVTPHPFALSWDFSTPGVEPAASLRVTVERVTRSRVYLRLDLQSDDPREARISLLKNNLALVRATRRLTGPTQRISIARPRHRITRVAVLLRGSPQRIGVAARLATDIKAVSRPSRALSARARG